MSLLDLLKKRYSVRNYRTDAVEQEKLNKILEAAWVAPTAGNQQPIQLLVVNTKEGFKKLNAGTNPHGAPIAIIVSANKDVVWTRPFDGHSMADIDAAIATDHMMLCAEDLGLSTCWLTYFKPEVIRQEFNIPDNLIPVNILVIGYSADQKPNSPERHTETRKPLKNMVTYGTF